LDLARNGSLNIALLVQGIKKNYSQ